VTSTIRGAALNRWLLF